MKETVKWNPGDSGAGLTVSVSDQLSFKFYHNSRETHFTCTHIYNINFVNLVIFLSPKIVTHISTKFNLKLQTSMYIDFGFRPCILNRAKVMKYRQIKEIVVIYRCLSF